MSTLISLLSEGKPSRRDYQVWPQLVLAFVCPAYDVYFGMEESKPFLAAVVGVDKSLEVGWTGQCVD